MSTYEIRFQDQEEKAEKLNLLADAAHKWEKLENLIFNFEVQDKECDDFTDFLDDLEVEYTYV